MSDNIPHMRLDEILLRDGLITEEHIIEALAQQKIRGGRLGSQLLYDGHIEEPALVRALATQSGCEGVVLSDIEVSDIIVRFIPARVAVARKVMPFDYDPENNILSIACEDPRDDSLLQELNFVARGKTVKLFLAAELTLINAIARHYLKFDSSTADGPMMELPEIDDTYFSRKKNNHSSEVDSAATAVRQVLLVTADNQVRDLLVNLLKQPDINVVVAESVTAASPIIDEKSFEHVFIHQDVCGQIDEFATRLRNQSPSTRLISFASPADLLMEVSARRNRTNLTIRNLDLLSSVVESLADSNTFTTARIGRYVDLVCVRMELPENDRLLVVSAAYLLNVATFYYGGERSTDRRTVIDLTVRLLKLLDYPKEILQILDSSYSDLDSTNRDHVSLAVLGGNIITVADRYVDLQNADTGSAMDKLEAAREEFKELEGIRYLPKVIRVFFEMLHDESLHPTGKGRFNQVLLFGRVAAKLSPLAERLRSDGFRTVIVYDAESFAELYNRSQPDIMIFRCDDDEQGTIDLLDGLAAGGIAFERTPSILLSTGSLLANPEKILERGIIDVLPLDDRLHVLGVRLRRIQREAQIDNEAAVSPSQASAKQIYD